MVRNTALRVCKFAGVGLVAMSISAAIVYAETGINIETHSEATVLLREDSDLASAPGDLYVQGAYHPEWGSGSVPWREQCVVGSGSLCQGGQSGGRPVSRGPV